MLPALPQADRNATPRNTDFRTEIVTAFEQTQADHTTRSTIIFLISAIAFAGFRPFGQVLAQFMILCQQRLTVLFSRASTV
jgi:hypothetical protein